MCIKSVKYLLVFLIFIAFACVINAQNNKICNYCSKPIAGQYIAADGKYFHTEHFLCAKCNKQITGSFMRKNMKFYHPDCYSIEEGLVCSFCGKILQGEYVIQNDKKYHQDCYENNILSKCSVCGLPLSGRYTIDMYGNKYHAAHLNESSKCDCCGRLISQNLTNGGIKYSDGRSICSNCYSDAIFKREDFERVLDKVMQRLISLGLKLDKRKIKIIGVDRNGLRSQAPDYTDKMQGYCNSETKTEYENNILTKQTTTHTIYVLTGVSSTAFESIIAHELMHSWIYDNTQNNHSDKTREGACNYISYLYLNNFPTKTSADFIIKLERNPDPVYGGGFVEIKNKFLNKPLNYLLSFLKN